MQSYVKKNKRPSGRTDELYVEINGDMNYMYALMDDEARFWIVEQFSDKSSRLI